MSDRVSPARAVALAKSQKIEVCDTMLAVRNMGLMMMIAAGILILFAS